MDLMGRIALVTGGSRGIGRAIADALHAAGAGVTILDRDAERAPITAREIGDDVCAMIADVTNPAEVAASLAAVEESCGPIDILVNNAGITKDGLLARMSDDDWDTVMDVNLRGAFLLTRAVARGMMKRRWGRIINISSVVGLMGNPGQANYAASKAGLIGFTKAVARELAPRNVLVNNAGITRDRSAVNMSDDEWDAVLSVNLTGAFRMIRALAPMMRKAGYGRIVNITSINGIRGKFGQANYAASKAGLIGLTKTLARELGPKGITVNAVAPGMVMTEMARGLPPEIVDRAKAEAVLPELATPEDVANTVLFLLSDAARTITGEVVRVDAGQYL